MHKRLILLISILIVLLGYFTIFSIRSPFKDSLFPIIYAKTAREILPDPEPSLNTHEIFLKSGSNINVELINETEDAYIIREHKDNQTIVEQTIKRDDVFSISIRQQALPVSSSEIITRRLFPKMQFYRLKNHTIFSNNGYSSIGPTAGTLKNLHKSITQAFPNIISFSGTANRICVVLFTESEEYKKLARKINPDLIDSIGCFSPDHNTLFINNDFSVRAKQAYPDDVIRHEGAHQLFYNAGLHFGWGLDRLWLVEGLAVYSEPSMLGKHVSRHQQRVKKALQQDQHFPIKTLLSIQRVDEKKSLLFYAQSWALTYFLMNQYKKEFSEYLLYVKKHPFLSRHKGDAKLLEDFIGKKIELIETEFKNFYD